MANTYKRIGSSSGGGGGDTPPYVLSFNATTSWGSATLGQYSIQVLESSHGKGADPIVQVYETILGIDQLVDVDSVLVNSSGDVTIQVTENLDTRFAGKIVIT